MITSISQKITESIIKQMKIAKMYSLMADEARDRCTEQLAVRVRFVMQKGIVADEIEAMLQSHTWVTYCVLHKPMMGHLS